VFTFKYNRDDELLWRLRGCLVARGFSVSEAVRCAVCAHAPQLRDLFMCRPSCREALRALEECAAEVAGGE